MDLLKIVTSQMLTFKEKKTICMSVNEVSRLFSVKALDYKAIEEGNVLKETEHLSRVIINLPQIKDLIIEIKLDGRDPQETNTIAQEIQNNYIVFLNQLRTLIHFNKVNDIIDLIEKSNLFNFVDKKSLELIKEELKKSSE